MAVIDCFLKYLPCNALALVMCGYAIQNRFYYRHFADDWHPHKTCHAWRARDDFLGYLRR